MMRSWGEDTVRGGQTVFHGVRMWGQLVRVGLLLTASLVLAVPAVQLLRTVPGYHLYAAGMLTLAEVKLSIGYGGDSGQALVLENGERAVSTLDDIVGYAPWHAARENLLETVRSGMWLGVRLGIGAVLLMLAWFRFQGRRMKLKKRVRGAELVPAQALSRLVVPRGARALQRMGLSADPYTIAGVPYPERAETQHTIVSGTTGSGKTVLISDIVQQIRDRGERCVIYDKMGSYTRAFFDPDRDVLLNPLDARAPRWSPFFEARSPRDFDTMAAALIPQQKDTVDPFWVTAARQLFANGAGVLWAKGEERNKALVEHLLKTDLSDLAKAMEGTVAQSIVDPNNPKTALSVRAMLTANIGAMEVLSDSGTPFSIREWVGNDRDGGSRRDNGFLFLTSRGDQHASLRGLISTWLEIAVNSMLSLEQDTGRRIWVILDELPTLHRVPSLQSGLAESRQFGGCFVLGVQVASALRDLYGKNGAETISGLCGTRVVFAAPDRDTAHWSAESLGRSEVEELSEGVSYGADPYRDGVTLMPRRELQSLALPSEIMRLPNLSGYLKLPGPFPVARVKLRYVHRDAVAPAFKPAPDGPPARGELLRRAPLCEADMPEEDEPGMSPGDGSGVNEGEKSEGQPAMPESQRLLALDAEPPDAEPCGGDDGRGVQASGGDGRDAQAGSGKTEIEDAGDAGESENDTGTGPDEGQDFY